MPLRQIARTPKTTFPPSHGKPYAFAVEVRQVSLIDDAALFTVQTVVRCPWCGCEHLARTGPEGDTCPDIGRHYVVAIPAGVPVLA